MEVAPGTVVLGRYRVDSVLGTGGMGNVVKATHVYMAQPVAIKFLRAELASDAGVVQRFLREAQATVKLRGDHAARVIDVGMMPDGTPFMVMEFLDGSDLGNILRHHGPQPPHIVVDWIVQVCEGLAEAHALGIVHRDIKPSNFYLTRKLDGSTLLKILDFGISKAPAGYDSALTSTQSVVGTPAYMSPEQMLTPRKVDTRSDVWSVGVVMYQLLGGTLPFQAELYPELCIKVGTQPPLPIEAAMPPGLGDVVMRCLEKEPGARFQSVAELAMAVVPFASDPNAAFAAAERTNRILIGQGQGQTLALGLGGGPPGTPRPSTPTPAGWRSSNSSLSHGAGQVMTTAHTRKGASRWIIIGATAAVVVGAGIGGWFALNANEEQGGKPADVKPAAGATAEPAPTPAPTPAPAVAPTPATAVAPTPPTPPAVDPAAAEKEKKAAAEKKAADEKKAAAEKKAADEKAAAEKKAAADEAEKARKVAKREHKKRSEKKSIKPPDKGGGEDDIFDRR